MKLLLFHAERFSFQSKNSDKKKVLNALVAFCHVESADQEQISSVVNKIVKTIKWLSNKRDTRTVVLHSFAHLSEDYAPAEFARQLLEDVDIKLTRAGFSVIHTPFGESCAWDLCIFDDALAKVFKSF